MYIYIYAVVSNFTLSISIPLKVMQHCLPTAQPWRFHLPTLSSQPFSFLQSFHFSSGFLSSSLTGLYIVFLYEFLLASSARVDLEIRRLYMKRRT
jgi:hypothetical protein